MISKYIKTAHMTAQNHTNGGILYLFPTYVLRLVYLLPLLMLWRTLFRSGVDTGMELQQMLTYTFVSALLSDLLTINSPLTHWICDGPLLSLYQRPMTIYGHVMAQTLGNTLPGLVFFTLPMVMMAPLFGVSIFPASIWFLPSLLLSISLGFAIEFIFASMMVRMINTSWLVYTIKRAISALFSGNLIPFAVMPWGLGEILKTFPLGSLGGAPLSIYTGLEEPLKIILVQVLWNTILWPVAHLIFKKAQERMVSQGG